MSSSVAAISLDAIQENIRKILLFAGQPQACLAVKADAYGHGIARVAAAAQEVGISYLGVAQAEEAEAIRESGVDLPILHFGSANFKCTQTLVELGAESFVFSEDGVRAFSSAATDLGKRIGLHLKVDTGMNRIGCKPEDALGLARLVQESPGVFLAGTATHLAVADVADAWGREGTNLQLDRFDAVVSELVSDGIDPGTKHAANTAGAIAHPRSRYDMVRLGIGAYGYYPSEDLERLYAQEIGLRPAMTWRTELSHVKVIEKDSSVSYGWKYNASDRRWIGTIPVGYADGLRRGLSGNFDLLVGDAPDQSFRQVGTICMDQCMVDLGPADDPAKPPFAPGTPVEVLGPGGGETAASLARKLGTIAYELCCGIGSRVERRYL